MKDFYIPEAKNDSIFSFIGNVDTLILLGVITETVMQNMLKYLKRDMK